MSINSDKGFTLTSTIAGLFVSSVVLVGIVNFLNYYTKLNKKAELQIAMLNVESRLLSSLDDEKNFSRFDIKYALQDGNVFPPIGLLDHKGDLFATIPTPVAREADISPSIQYFDVTGKRCTDLGVGNCFLQLEVSMQVKAGRVDPRVSIGTPSWLTAAQQAMAPFAIWGVAYRITVHESSPYKLSQLGIQHQANLTIDDHIYPFPMHLYKSTASSHQCDPGGIVAGIDSKSGLVKCIYPQDMCADKRMLAKEIVIDVDSQGIGVECVPWKSVSCPQNYVFLQINPRRLDSEVTGNRGVGRCVYFGKDRQPYSFSARTSVDVRCPSRYDVARPRCRILNEFRTPCRNAGGNTRPPNRGRARYTASSGSQGQCQVVQPRNICPAGYSGGSWDAVVEATGVCRIRRSERIMEMIVSG